MIWTAISRSTSLLFFASMAMSLVDMVTREEVRPTRIYNSSEAARLLGIERKQLIRLIKSGEVRGKMVNGNYRIPGQSIMEYLNK